MSTSKKAATKGTKNKNVTRRSKLDGDNLSQYDYDVLTMTPLEAAKKYKTNNAVISNRKFTIQKKLGKTFLPKAPTKNNGVGAVDVSKNFFVSTESGLRPPKKGGGGVGRKSLRGTQKGDSLVDQKLLPVFERTAEGKVAIKFGGVVILMNDMPNSFKVNPTQRTLEVD